MEASHNETDTKDQTSKMGLGCFVFFVIGLVASHNVLYIISSYAEAGGVQALVKATLFFISLVLIKVSIESLLFILANLLPKSSDE